MPSRHQTWPLAPCASRSLPTTELTIAFSGNGNFLIDDKYTIEVGGKGKSFSQIKDVPDSYLALGDMEYGHLNKIPLWLFGFLY